MQLTAKVARAVRARHAASHARARSVLKRRPQLIRVLGGPEQHMRSIDRTAARWVLGLSAGTKLVRAAVDALREGYDGPSLRVLAGYDDPAPCDIAALVEQCFDELKASRPDRRDAALLLAREHAEGIMNGSLQPYEGASLIWRQLATVIRPEDHSLDGFVYWADEYEDASDEQRSAECEAAILETARLFLAAGGDRPALA
jgi:hypothetical protein